MRSSPSVLIFSTGNLLSETDITTTPSPDTVETWVSRWIYCPIAYLCPKERREEWLGDLYEVNSQMIQQGYPRWLINIVDGGKALVIALSAIQIKITDFF